MSVKFKLCYQTNSQPGWDNYKLLIIKIIKIYLTALISWNMHHTDQQTRKINWMATFPWILCMILQIYIQHAQELFYFIPITTQFHNYYQLLPYRSGSLTAVCQSASQPTGSLMSKKSIHLSTIKYMYSTASLFHITKCHHYIDH